MIKVLLVIKLKNFISVSRGKKVITKFAPRRSIFFYHCLLFNTHPVWRVHANNVRIVS